MSEREKIILTLEACLEPDCRKCPHNNDLRECGALGAFEMLPRQYVLDAIDLLKAQVPRILNPEEIPDFDGAIYLEDFGEPEIVIAVYDRGLAGYVKFAIRGNRSTLARFTDYNKRWRAWTARPTEEQRKAVNWNA